jgi:hypothetical protein
MRAQRREATPSFFGLKQFDGRTTAFERGVCIHLRVDDDLWPPITKHRPSTKGRVNDFTIKDGIIAPTDGSAAGLSISDLTSRD